MKHIKWLYKFSRNHSHFCIYIFLVLWLQHRIVYYSRFEFAIICAASHNINDSQVIS